MQARVEDEALLDHRTVKAARHSRIEDHTPTVRDDTIFGICHKMYRQES